MALPAPHIGIQLDEAYDVTSVDGEAVIGSEVSESEKEGAEELGIYKLFRTTNPGTVFFCRVNPATGRCF